MAEERLDTRCFRTYRIPYSDPKDLSIKVCRGGEGYLNIGELQSEWRDLVAQHSRLRLNVEFQEGWKNEGVWNLFHGFIKEVSPQIETFGIPFLPVIDDEEWALLLQQLPRDLVGLSITTEIPSGNPRAYQVIGKSFPQLQSLVVYHGDGCPLWVARKTLPRVIRNLPALRKLTLWNLPGTSYDIRWSSLVGAIQSRNTLEEVNVLQGYTFAGQDRAINPFSDDELEAIQFHPRLNEAKRKHLSAGDNYDHPAELEHFVAVLIDVCDRVDCLHHFFAAVDPTLFAQAAVLRESD